MATLIKLLRIKQLHNKNSQKLFNKNARYYGGHFC
jgi:hypothetical protein